MSYLKFNVLAELKRQARGQKTKALPELVAMLAIPLVVAGLTNNEVEELERLYRLEDPRG